MLDNYLVRLSQQEDKGRSYQQQNCSPGQRVECLGLAPPSPRVSMSGGGWAAMARCHNYTPYSQ